MTYNELVETIREKSKKANVSAFHEHIAYQVDIEGEAAGSFYIEVVPGQGVNVEPYEYNDRDALITTSADTLIKIINKDMDAILAFTLGRLKIKGDLGKAAMIKELFKS